MLGLRRRRPIRRETTPAMLRLDDEQIHYTLKRSSARRTLALRVAEDGEIRVNAPFHLPRGEVESFLRRHAEWLRVQRRRQASRPPAAGWREGREVPYLGGMLTLAVGAQKGDGAVRQAGRRLVCAADADALAGAVTAWYRHQAEAILAAHLVSVCRRHGLPLPAWRLSDARTRWGSLSAKGVVSLNWRLVKASRAEIDYVVCHELAHLRHPNHSAAFWREVARLCPDYQAPRARLREQYRLYMEF